MKTKKLSIAIALLAVAVIGTSCGNKQQKSSSDTTTEQTTSSALEIDSLLANAENLAGKEVTIEGVCTHTCKHGAKKIFLMGSDDTQVIRVEAGTLGAFDPKCVNSIVRVTGTLKEQRIDEAYLQNWVAQAEEFVRKLPDGLDTRILQGGENLSGGQKQRLTIARALVGSPEILVLDDSASALDFATDAALRRAIAALDKEMTVLIVSQRANTVRYADQIVVLDDGKAVGIGTHEQLLESCEEYQEIYWSQNERVLAKEEA